MFDSHPNPVMLVLIWKPLALSDEYHFRNKLFWPNLSIGSEKVKISRTGAAQGYKIDATATWNISVLARI